MNRDEIIEELRDRGYSIQGEALVLDDGRVFVLGHTRNPIGRTMEYFITAIPCGPSDPFDSKDRMDLTASCTPSWIRNKENTDQNVLEIAIGCLADRMVRRVPWNFSKIVIDITAGGETDIRWASL